MGKKVEKSLSKEKHSTVPEEVDVPKPGEPYKCSGNFQVDLTALCKRKQMPYIPPVVLRSKVPVAQILPSSDVKIEKKSDKRHQTPGVEPEVEAEHHDSVCIEGPPKTYVTRDKFQYFMPNIQVELENPEKWETLTEIYIRGWKIDQPMIDVFQQCWLPLHKLHTINLWNTGLTEETLHALAEVLPHCLHIKNVVLDGNAVKEENWFELILDNSLIQSLSLRHCKITDQGISRLATALGNTMQSNRKLLVLNLSGNFISDDGAEALARGLRMNRTLLSLTLTDNNIGDRGAVKIAETLSHFPLTHEEVVMKRKLMSERALMDVKSPNPTRRSDSKDRPSSVSRSTATQDKSKQKALTKKKDTKIKDSKEDLKSQKKEKEESKPAGRRAQANQNAAGGRMSSASNSSDLNKSGTKTKDKKKDKGKTASETDISETANTETQDHIHPLLEVTYFIDGQSWLPGNRVLINLNLSRNNIGEVGMAALLKAIQYQTTLTIDDKSFGSGLLRLDVSKNAVSPESETVTKLRELMMTKDPFFKAPSMPESV